LSDDCLVADLEMWVGHQSGQLRGEEIIFYVRIVRLTT